MASLMAGDYIELSGIRIGSEIIAYSLV